MTSGSSVHAPEALREAAQWLTRLKSSECGETERRAFAEWLKRSPVHVEHYLELAALEVRLLDRAVFEGVELDAGANSAAANVVPMKVAAAPHPRKQPPRSWRFAAAAALGCITLAITLLYGHYSASERYRSAVGELRSIALLDGSIVTLNTQSEIEVRYTADARVVRLLKGEAFFRVAAQPSAPFSVHVDDTVVRALGTAFNVYRHSGANIVTVTEGRVAVSMEAGQTANILTVGEQTTAGAGDQAVLSVRRLNAAAIAQVTSWTQRQLIFDDAPVGEVVAELNRYSHLRLVVDDPKLAQRRVTGTFESSDLNSFLDFLAAQSAVIVHKDGTGVIRLKEKGGESIP